MIFVTIITKNLLAEIFCKVPLRLLAWACFRDGDRATTEIGLIEHLHRVRLLVRRVEFDEAESTLAASFLLNWKENRDHSTCGAEMRLELVFSSCIRDAADENACVVCHNGLVTSPMPFPCSSRRSDVTDA